MSNIIPIWTPQDSIDTAQAFAAELDAAERGRPEKPRWTSKLFGRSRFRRARILDGLAVALLMALMVALGTVVFAASAKADTDPTPAVIDYVVTYGSGAICPVIDNHYSIPGLMGVLLAIEKDGFTGYQAGQIVGMSVAEYCPRNQPLLDRFVAVYGDKAAVA